MNRTIGLPIRILLAVVFFGFYTTAMNAQQAIKICDAKDVAKRGLVRIMQSKFIKDDIKPAEVTGDDLTMPGYRIQVYAGTDRAAAQKLKNDLSSNYNVPTYMIYEAPYFKVRVGDYRTKIEAQQLFHALKASNSGILLVPGTIILPELKP